MQGPPSSIYLSIFLRKQFPGNWATEVRGSSQLSVLRLDHRWYAEGGAELPQLVQTIETLPLLKVLVLTPPLVNSPSLKSAVNTMFHLATIQQTIKDRGGKIIITKLNLSGEQTDGGIDPE